MVGNPLTCLPLRNGKPTVSYMTQNKVPKTYSVGSHPATCRSNRELVNGLCYTKCELGPNTTPRGPNYGECYTGNPGAPTQCMPKKGTSYIAPDNGCPKAGYVDTGAGLCSNWYTVETYPKKSKLPTCTQDSNGNPRDTIAGLCYPKCPTIKDGSGNTIQLGHIDGIPTQCGPPRGGKHPISYPAGYLSYFTPQYMKKRKIPYSTK